MRSFSLIPIIINQKNLRHARHARSFLNRKELRIQTSRIILERKFSASYLGEEVFRLPLKCESQETSAPTRECASRRTPRVPGYLLEPHSDSVPDPRIIRESSVIIMNARVLIRDNHVKTHLIASTQLCGMLPFFSDKLPEGSFTLTPASRWSGARYITQKRSSRLF